MFINLSMKIGVGIITCNRPEYLQSLMNSLPAEHEGKIDHLVVVNDGKPITEFDLSFGQWIDNDVNLGVGKSKNRAMQHLLDKGCDYIFIIEDDMIVLDSNVFNVYINTHKVTGIQHFNYGPGSPFNRKQSIKSYDLHNRHLLDNCTEPSPRLTVEYTKDIAIDLYEHIVGSFSFFTRQILEKVGLHDETFINAWEHVDHTYRIILKGDHPPFWWFADIRNSVNYLKVQEDAIEKSTTSTNQKEWLENINKGREIYLKKHGVYPNTTPFQSKQNVIKSLKIIKSKWTILP